MDNNANGIPDSGEISFHLKSAIVGAIVALLVGGTSFTIIGSIAPDVALVQAIGKAFAGGVCDSIKEDLANAEKALVCFEAGGIGCTRFLGDSGTIEQ